MITLMSRLVLSMALLIYGAGATYAQACQIELIDDQLRAHGQYFDGDLTALERAVSKLEVADITAIESSDEYIFLCNTALFSVARVTSLLFQMDRPSSYQNAQVDKKVRYIKFLKEVLKVYNELELSYADAGLKGDNVVSELGKLAEDINRIFYSISSQHSDRIISPITFDGQVDQVYRVFFVRDNLLHLYEAGVSATDGTIRDGEAAIPRLARDRYAFDTLKTPGDASVANDLVDEWARSRRLRVEPGSGWGLFLGQRHVFEFHFLGNPTARDSFKALDAILEAFAVFVEPNPFDKSDVEPVVEGDADVSTLTECVRYKTPSDNDLLGYSEPIIDPNQPPQLLPVAIAEKPIIVLSGPHRSQEQTELTRKLNDGREVHVGHRVLSWLEVEIIGRSFFVVYEKSTPKLNKYNRFEVVSCQ